MVRRNTTTLCIIKLNSTVASEKYVFISLLHLLKLSGRFRVGVGVGGMLFSNMIEH